MALNASAYRILLEAQIKPGTLDAQIKSIAAKHTILLNAKFDQNDLANLNSQLNALKASGAQILKVNVAGNASGGIKEAAVQYLDINKDIVSTTLKINSGVEVTQHTMQNLARDAKEYEKALMNAERFLARAKNLSQTPSVKKAVATAEGLKIAIEDGDIEKVRELNNQLSVQKSALTTGRTALASWTEGMKSSIKHVVQYTLSVGMLYAALGQLRQGFQYIIDLNKELTNIQLVTGESDEQVANLALQYNKLGKELAVSTIEITKGSLEFIRQGKTAEETATLIRNATIMGKLGNIEAAESSELLTSIMNGFKLSAEETGEVVDKLVAIDNSAATSVKELATAMQYSSSTAQQVGIDFDHLAAYIGTISAVTRRSSEEIGQSMKTVALRMTAVKNMEAFDSEGEAVNKVESALAGVNVHLRDQEGHFRNMQDVLDELAMKWDTFTREEQIFIAQQIGGVRQADKLLALLSNQAEIQKQLNAERDSANLKEERYAIYLKSIEAAQNKVLVSWQSLMSTATTKDFITGILNNTSAILDFVNAIGGIPTVLSVVIPLLIIFNWNAIITAKTNMANSLWAAVSAFRGLATSLFVVNPAMAETAILEGGVATGLYSISTASAVATLGVTALIGAFIWGIGKIREFKLAQDEVRASLQESGNKTASDSETYQEYVKKQKEAIEEKGYSVDEENKVFHYGYHNLQKIYTNDLKILTEEEWKAKKAIDAKNDSLEKVPANEPMADYGAKQSSEESKKAFKEITEMVVDMIKQRKEAEKDALKDQLDALKATQDAAKDYYQEAYDEEKRLNDEKKQNADDELDRYVDLIDAQKALLKEKQAATEYDRKQQENQSDLARMESDIATLALDDSQEALAKRLELEEEAGELRKEMNEDVEDETVRLQEVALDNEKKAAQERHDMRIQELEEEQQAADRSYEIQVKNLEDKNAAEQKAIQDKIDQIDNYLNQQGTLLNDARSMIVNSNAETFQSLIEWNKVYGTGLKEDVVSVWELAKDAVGEYQKSLEYLKASSLEEYSGENPFQGSYNYDQLSKAQGIDTSKLPSDNFHYSGRHSGVDTGPVKGKFSLKSNEEFAKLLSGEVVVNPNQMNNFMTTTLPKITKTASSGVNIGDINISIPVSGNLDKQTVPDIKKAVFKAINEALSSRGYNRTAESFGS